MEPSPTLLSPSASVGSGAVVSAEPYFFFDDEAGIDESQEQHGQLSFQEVLIRRQSALFEPAEVLAALDSPNSSTPSHDRSATDSTLIEKDPEKDVMEKEKGKETKKEKDGAVRRFQHKPGHPAPRPPVTPDFQSPDSSLEDVLLSTSSSSGSLPAGDSSSSLPQLQSPTLSPSHSQSLETVGDEPAASFDLDSNVAGADLYGNVDLSTASDRSVRSTVFVRMPLQRDDAQLTASEAHAAEADPVDIAAALELARGALSASTSATGTGSSSSGTVSQNPPRKAKFMGIRSRLKLQPASNTNVVISSPKVTSHVAHAERSNDWSLASLVEPRDFKFYRVAGARSSLVAKAVHEPTSYVVAIKRIQLRSHARLAPKEAGTALLTSLRHPSLAGFFGGLAVGDEFWIFMEWCNVGSAEDVVNLRKEAGEIISEAEIGQFVRSTLEALQFLHRSGHGHMAIKPSGMMITRSNALYSIKLANFAMAQRLTVRDERIVANQQLLNPSFESPEVLHGGMPAPESDIWSLGVAVVALANCDLLPYGSKMFGAVLTRLAELSDPLELLRAESSQEMRGFVHACLVRDPMMRPGATQLLSHAFVPESDPAVVRAIALNLTRLRTLRSHDEAPTLRTDDCGSSRGGGSRPTPSTVTGGSMRGAPAGFALGAENGAEREPKSSERESKSSSKTRRKNAQAPAEFVIGAPTDFRKVDVALAAEPPQGKRKDKKDKDRDKDRSEELAIGLPTGFRKVDDSEKNAMLGVPLPASSTNPLSTTEKVHVECDGSATLTSVGSGQTEALSPRSQQSQALARKKMMAFATSGGVGVKDLRVLKANESDTEVDGGPLPSVSPPLALSPRALSPQAVFPVRMPRPEAPRSVPAAPAANALTEPEFSILDRPPARRAPRPPGAEAAGEDEMRNRPLNQTMRRGRPPPSRPVPKAASEAPL